MACPNSVMCVFSVFPSPDQQGGAPHGSMLMNTGGSLPDLSSLHFPSPLPTPLDPDEPGYPSLSGGGSTGNLTCTLTQLGIHGASGQCWGKLLFMESNALQYCVTPYKRN